VQRGDLVLPLKERMEPDPLTAPVIQRIFAWVDAGKSLNWVAASLSGKIEDGTYSTPTPREYAEIAGTNSDGAWQQSTLVGLLKNPAYQGKYAACRTKRVPRDDGSERHKQVLLPEDQWIYVEPSPTPALVDPAQWQRVQRQLATNKQYAARNTQAPMTAEQALLYRGMARCGECGGRMATKAIPRYVTRRYRYVCDNTYRNQSCPGVGWLAKATDVDAAVWQAVIDILCQPDIMDDLAQKALEDDQERAGGRRGVVVVTPQRTFDEVEKKLAAKEQALRNLTLRSARYAPGDPELVGYDMAISAAGSEVTALRAERERAAKKLARYVELQRALGSWEDYMEDLAQQIDIMADPKLPAMLKRRWLEAMGARVIMHRRDPQHSEAPIATLEFHLQPLTSRNLGVTGVGNRKEHSKPVASAPVFAVTPRAESPAIVNRSSCRTVRSEPSAHGG
jgi:Recombinase/Recombinase zinc beta ribbon domain